MAPIKEIVIAFLVVAIAFVASAPTPGGQTKHEKYIIHVPIKYHTIHHVKIQKVPVHVKKHIHHHKYEEHKPQHHKQHGGYDRYDDLDDNSSYESYDGSEEYYR